VEKPGQSVANTGNGSKGKTLDGIRLGAAIPMTLVAAVEESEYESEKDKVSLFWYHSRLRSTNSVEKCSKEDPSQDASSFLDIKRVQPVSEGFSGVLVSHSDACAIADVFFAEAHDALRNDSIVYEKGSRSKKNWKLVVGESAQKHEGKGNRAGIFGESVGSDDAVCMTAFPMAVLKVPESYRCEELNANGIPPRNRCYPLFTFEQVVHAIQNLHHHIPITDNAHAVTASIQRYVIAKGNNPWLVRIESCWSPMMQWQSTEKTNTYCLNGKSHFMTCKRGEFVPNSVKQSDVWLNHVSGTKAWQEPKACTGQKWNAPRPPLSFCFFSIPHFHFSLPFSLFPPPPPLPPPSSLVVQYATDRHHLPPIKLLSLSLATTDRHYQLTPLLTMTTIDPHPPTPLSTKNDRHHH
jgi:hypothetical protein